MNVTRLRHLIKRRGNLGVAIAGAYLAGYFAWTRHRRSTVTALIVLAALTFSAVHPRYSPVHQALTVPTQARTEETPQQPAEAEDVASTQVTLPYPHRLLTPRSRVVVPLNNHFCDYAWLSPTRLMLVWSDHPDDGATLSGLKSWTGKVEEMNVLTRRSRPLSGITKLLHLHNGIPGDFRMSPGGTWLEWTYLCTGDAWPFPAGARMDGSGFQHWDQDKWSETGWLNDHQWAEVGSRPITDDADTNPVSIRDLDRHSTEKLNGVSSVGRDTAHQMRALNGGDIYDGLGLDGPIEIDMCGAKVIADKYQALQEISTGHVRIRDVNVYMAHHASHICYVVRFSESSRARHAHRVSPSYADSEVANPHLSLNLRKKA